MMMSFVSQSGVVVVVGCGVESRLDVALDVVDVEQREREEGGFEEIERDPTETTEDDL